MRNFLAQSAMVMVGEYQLGRRKDRRPASAEVLAATHLPCSIDLRRLPSLHLASHFGQW